MYELSIDQIEEVNGGMISDDAIYGASVGVSGALLIGALTIAGLTTGGIALFLAGSIVASSNAIYIGTK